MNYVDDILNFEPSCEQEENDKKLIEALIKEYKDKLLYRECELFHLTSSGFTMNQNLDKTLMVYHNIYDSWSWIGGHADGENNLLAVALKEVQEETGVTIVNPLSEQPVSIDILTTSAHKKNGKHVSSHLHLNISYLIIADENESIRIKPDENSGVKWISVDEMEQYVTEPEMLIVYRKILERVKNEFLLYIEER